MKEEAYPLLAWVAVGVAVLLHQAGHHAVECAVLATVLNLFASFFVGYVTVLRVVGVVAIIVFAGWDAAQHPAVEKRDARAETSAQGSRSP